MMLILAKNFINIFFVGSHHIVNALLTNLEYASLLAILQVVFSLTLVFIVYILKKIKFSKVLTVEENLNTVKIFNSSFTFGPLLTMLGLCLLLMSMVIKRVLKVEVKMTNLQHS